MLKSVKGGYNWCQQYSTGLAYTMFSCASCWATVWSNIHNSHPLAAAVADYSSGSSIKPLLNIVHHLIVKEAWTKTFLTCSSLNWYIPHDLFPQLVFLRFLCEKSISATQSYLKFSFHDWKVMHIRTCSLIIMLFSRLIERDATCGSGLSNGGDDNVVPNMHLEAASSMVFFHGL